MGITDSQLSFVLQGPVAGAEGGAFLARSVDILRRDFPGAEIIIATWRGTPLPPNKADRILLLDDPGELHTAKLWWNRFKFRNHNTKRMIWSSLCGLQACGRPYAIKIRTDASLRGGPHLLAELQAAMAKPPGETGGEKGPRTFEQRILVGRSFSRNPRHSALLFHLSDIFLGGRTADLTQLFENAWRWLAKLERATDKPIPWLCPEQFLWLPSLNGENTSTLSYGFAFSPGKVIRYEKAVLAKVVIADEEKIGLEHLRHFPTGKGNCYTEADLEAYRRSACAGPWRHWLALAWHSGWRNLWSQASLLNVGLKSKVLRLLGLNRDKKTTQVS